MQAIIDWFFQADLPTKIISGTLASIILALLTLIFRPVRERTGRQLARLRAFIRAGNRLDGIIQSVNGEGVWKSREPVRPANYDAFYHEAKPILMVANLKGGVGKTTIAANLGAYFSQEKQERVLYIDLDFQGSLSAMLLKREHRLPAQSGSSKAAQLVEHRMDAGDLVNAAFPAQNLSRCNAIPAYYDLARSENRAMIHWLAQATERDIRYDLALVLHDPLIWNSFDRIIIDAPPRMTTATVQALCASTHILIPTILDGLSSEAVASFIDQIETHRTIWPRLRYVGVCASMTHHNVGAYLGAREGADPDDAFLVAEREGRLAVKDAIARVSAELDKDPVTSLLPPDSSIARRADISQSAGEAVAFLNLSNPDRDMFRRLGAEVAMRMRR